MPWRYLSILLLLLCCSLAWAVDGELRLLYIGNLATGDEAAQAQVMSQVTSLRAQAMQEHVPTLLVSPGVLLGGERHGACTHRADAIGGALSRCGDIGHARGALYAGSLATPTLGVLYVKAKRRAGDRHARPSRRGANTGRVPWRSARLPA